MIHAVTGTYVFDKGYVLSLQIMFSIRAIWFLCNVTAEVRDPTHTVKVKTALVVEDSTSMGLYL